jgi:SWI/SNF-related matrix-associated actin-dependent regulator of chromatin subfamily A member 5
VITMPRKKKEEEDFVTDPMSDDEQEDDGAKTSKDDDFDYQESDEEKKPRGRKGKSVIKSQEREHMDRIAIMREEQRKRLQQLREKQAQNEISEEQADEEARTIQDRFKYLLEQTEIFSHFMSGGSQTVVEDTKKKGKAAGGKRTRKMTEKQEDEEILRETIEDEEVMPAHITSRLTSSPAFIKNTTLRDYQIEGLNWLIKLYDNGVNGILADEMGLGKTVQTIAFLAYLKFIRKINGPHIIVVPKSVISNWISQTAKWCPDLTVFKFHGDKDEREEMKKNDLLPGKFDLCVTSYEIAIKEKAALNRFQWKYIIIDEAHRIKNENSVLSQCVRLFDTQYRLLLTGTPLQNNLHELWALLNFLLPEVFDNAEDFDAWFNLKEGQAETEIITQLHKVLKPFMLRRLKSDVETAIPPKKEIIVECGMSKMQKEWYRSILTKDINALKGGEKLRLLNIVMQLRKCCNHPYLFDGAEPGPPYTLDTHLINNAGKMVLLDRLLTKLKTQGSRVLIFSQMTRMLDILEDYCYFKQYQYCRIDGQTSGDVREASMDEFNKEGSEKFIFLLSTRAGGLGINLATADTVVIYDSDWNPQADLQAQDRCHRIGQKKPVNVYRLITKDSIEEKIYQRAVKKLYLDAVVIQQGRLVEQEKKMSKTELLGMIKFGAEEIFKSTEATITDEDLDAILTRGEKKAQEIDKQYKESCQNNLLNFSLSEDANLYEFEGLDYSQKPTTSIIVDGIDEEVTEDSLAEDCGDFGKQLDDVIISYEKKSALLYFKNKNSAIKALEKLNSAGKQWKIKFCRKNDAFIQQLEQAASSELAGRRGERNRNRNLPEEKTRIITKGPKYNDFQFLNIERLNELSSKEQDTSKEQEEGEGGEQNESMNVGLTEEEQQEKESLLNAGFSDWTKRDFQAFVKGCEKYGRNDIAAIAKEVEGKTEQEVEAYSKVFWERYKEINDWDKLIKRIEKGEAHIHKIDNNNYMLKYKTQKYQNPWSQMKFNYGQNKGKHYTDEEDRFIVCMTAQLGYGQWEEVRNEIRKCWDFRFDWFFKSRTGAELQRRCDSLIRLIEKEHAEDVKNSGGATPKRKIIDVDGKTASSKKGKKRTKKTV